jgi:hypothetical protein
MSTYELYYGGPRQQNNDWAIFPSAPFATTNPAAQGPANKTPVIFGAERTLDFTNDVALNYFYTVTLASTGIVTGDHVGAVVIPSQSVLLGIWWKVNNPVTGAAFNLGLRELGTTFFTTPQSAAAVASGFLLPIAQGTTVASTVGALQPQVGPYFSAPDILDVQFTTVPGGGILALSLTVTPVFYNFQVGQN